MHTKDMLADELMKVGLMDMSIRARTGYYHDFLSPLDTPELQLIADLAQFITQPGVRALRNRVIRGDFDASTEESEEWAASEEGQAAMKMLHVTKVEKDKP